MYMNRHADPQRIEMTLPLSSLVLGLALLVGLLTILPRASSAKEYQSGFGFGMSVPDVWLVLTQSGVAANADLLLGDSDPTGESVLDAIPPDTRRVVFERIRRGDLEILYRRDAPPEGFVDNINVMRQTAPFPVNAEQVGAICKLLPIEFSRIFGRPIAMHVCEQSDLFGRRALHFQFDGAVQGTQSLQVQIEREAGHTIVLTATVAESNLPQMQSEFEAIVNSIRFGPTPTPTPPTPPTPTEEQTPAETVED